MAWRGPVAWIHYRLSHVPLHFNVETKVGMPNKSWKRSGTMAHARREAIVSALKATNYNLSAAAGRLEVSRSTLYRLLEKYQVELEFDPTVQNEFLEEALSFSIATTSGKSGSDPANRRPTRLEIRDGKLVLVGIME